MSDPFDKGDIARLREIQARSLRSGHTSLSAEIEAFIGHLQDSKADAIASEDPRIAQAKRLWDKGFGLELGFDLFDDYLATIPEVPEFAASYPERFPILVLVDARLTISKSCQLAGLTCCGDAEMFVDFDSRKSKTEKVYWMKVQDGRKNRGKSVTACRKSFTEDEIGLTAMEGIALYVQNPKVIKGHYLDLPGSVGTDSRDYSARLGDWDDGPGIYWGWHRLDRHHGHEKSSCGSASRGE